MAAILCHVGGSEQSQNRAANPSSRADGNRKRRGSPPLTYRALCAVSLMMQPTVNLDAIVASCRDLLERMHQKNRGQFEVDSLYMLVASKLFIYALNTFKSIYYLLPHTVYEQASVLSRTLWETSVNLEWIAIDPEPRAHRFLQFTAVEHRRFIEARIRTARRAQDSDVALGLNRQLGSFERALEQQLAGFSFSDKRGRKRWRERFSAPTLQDVVREVGGEWLDEYDRDYLLGCNYTHGTPGAVLFPLYDTPDHQLDKVRSLERSGVVGAMAIAVMSRTYRRWLSVRGMADDDFLHDIRHRVWEAGRA
jgi:hypothetical protein